ncbi:hypothetical protein [Halobellus captivus]|nr:hypothetical protein [Halobellus captivus]
MVALALGFQFIILSLGVLLFVVAGGPIDLTEFESPFIYLFAMAWGTVWDGGQEDLGWRGFMLPILQDPTARWCRVPSWASRGRLGTSRCS